MLGWEPRIPLRQGLERTVAYFGDLLPSGMMWSKVKQVLKKRIKVRIWEGQKKAIDKALDRMSPEGANGWFKSRGYIFKVKLL